MTVTIKTDISSVPGVTTKEITDTIPVSSEAVAEDQEVHATTALVADNSEDKGEAIVDMHHAASPTRNKGEKKER